MYDIWDRVGLERKEHTTDSEPSCDIVRAIAGNLFIAAVLTDRIDLVEEILGHQEKHTFLDIDFVNKKDGATAFLQACQLKRFALAKILIENGADVKAKDAQGKTALIHCSGVKDNAECNKVVEMIFQRAGQDIGFIEAKDSSEKYATLECCRSGGNTFLLDLILKSPAHPRMEDRLKFMNAACLKGNSASVKVFTQNGMPMHEIQKKILLDAMRGNITPFESIAVTDNSSLKSAVTKSNQGKS